MTLPKNWGELPLELLLKINELFLTGNEQPVPQFYLRLALVNKRWRDAFMSDPVWRILDIHEVERNISAHYLKLKRKMSRRESVFCGNFDFAEWQHPAVTLKEFNGFSLYTQGSTLAESHQGSASWRAKALLGKVPFTLRAPLRGRIVNRQLLLYATARTGSGLWFAHRTLTQDRDFMLLAADRGIAALYASVELRGDKEFILRCVKSDETALFYTPGSLKNDKEVVMAYLSKWGNCFGFVSNALRDDREAALAAISRDPMNLSFCSNRLKDDREVVMAALRLDSSVIKYASRGVRRQILSDLRASRQTCLGKRKQSHED